MPTYVYACKNCGHQFEKYQSFTEDPLHLCPECGQEALRKVFNSVGIVFKGSGFYSTDSAGQSSQQSAAAAKDSSETGSGSSSDSGSGSSSDSSGSSSSGSGSSEKTAAPAAASAAADA